EARAFVDVDKGVADAEAALAGARDICAERMAETAAIRAAFRERFEQAGELVSRAARGKARERSKFEQYYDFRERVARIPSHRYLAIRRGENDGFLKAAIAIDEERALRDLENLMGVDGRSPWAGELRAVIADGYGRLLAPAIDSEVRGALLARSERAAVEVFAEYLEILLMAEPLCGEPIIGIDPE